MSVEYYVAIKRHEVLLHMDEPETSHTRSHVVGFHVDEVSKTGRKKRLPRAVDSAESNC